MSYDDRNRGTLGKNDRRTKDTHPTHAGKCNIDGREYWISAWVQTNKQDGSKFFSLSFKPKDQGQQRGAEQSAPAGGDPYNDDIPFAPLTWND